MSCTPAVRPRICIVNPFQYGGGAEYQIQCLLDELAARGTCDLFYLAHHVDPSVPQGHYRVVKIGTGDAVPRLGYLMDAVPLYRALRAIGPQVVYQRVAGGYTAICGYYARVVEARFVWHVSSDNDVSLKSAFGERNPLRRFLDRRSIVYGLRRATYIVTQTHAQSRLMQANFGRAADAIVPNFHPAVADNVDKSGPVTVVWVSNVKPLKQPEIFVRLARSMLDIKGVRFVMVGAPQGSGDRLWTAELMASIRSTPNLEFLGKRTQAEVNALLARSHLFVNTSTREGFPNTFIQSWMRGVPVVSLNVDPDGVLERELLGAHAGSEDRLAQTVRSFVVNEDRRAMYAQRAVAYAARAHSMANAAILTDLLTALAT